MRRFISAALAAFALVTGTAFADGPGNMFGGAPGASNPGLFSGNA